jgi:hypothetical protein
LSVRVPAAPRFLEEQPAESPVVKQLVRPQSLDAICVLPMLCKDLVEEVVPGGELGSDDGIAVI